MTWMCNAKSGKGNAGNGTETEMHRKSQRRKCLDWQGNGYAMHGEAKDLRSHEERWN